jgi:hypothetical protein
MKVTEVQDAECEVFLPGEEIRAAWLRVFVGL